jgi:peptidoglycan/xylan/chitin deacetylase (PgdA/CDA1 family)
MSVPADRLRSQLESLLDRGYRGTTFTSALLHPRKGKWLVVTFDDGFRSVVSQALPVLSDLGLPGTAFVPTSFVGGSCLAWPGFDAGSATDDELTPMSKADPRQLVDHGWEVGSHSRTHAFLTTLPDTQLADELGRSREEATSQTGVACTSIAYPFGDADARVAAAAERAGYQAGAVLGRLRGRPSLLLVPRVGVYRCDGAFRFRAKTSIPLQSAPVGLAITEAHRARHLVGDRPHDRSLT